MPFLLLALFILVPIAELAIIIQVGQQIGVMWTIALLIADSILGTMLMRSQGRIAWRRFNKAIAQRRPPAGEAIDGVLVIFGGALLLTPGFISDFFGLLFLLPPSRAVIRRMIVARYMGRIVASAVGRPGPGRADRKPPSRPAHDIEGTATEIDP